MHGNVSEWVQDGWDAARYGRFRDQPAVNPVTAYSPKTPRVPRGGSFAVTPFNSRSALRVPLEDIQSRYSHIGFRVSLGIDAVRQAIASGNLAGDPNREVAWWALAGNELRNKSSEVKVDLDGVNSTFTSTEQLPNKAFAVTELKVYGKPFQADDLEKLAGLSRLAVLRFILNPVGDDLTRHLGRLTGLVHLQLNQCGLTDVGVERLGTLSKLQYLDVNWSSGITDRGLAVVERMPQMSTLSLINTSVTDKGLSSLHQLPLNALFLSDTKVTDAGMTMLAELRSLEVLELNGTSVGDEGVAQLASLPKLRTLALQKTALTDRGLEHLETVRSLQTLYVGGTKVTAAGVASLQKKLPNCKITVDLAPSDSLKPAEVATVPSASVWDLLDAAQIPAAERVPEQPKELVAVLGEHRQRHAGGVTTIQIRPDGKQFVTMARDGLRFWDAATIQQTSHFRPAGYERSAAAYLPRRKQLIVGGEGNRGQIWSLDENGISSDPPVSLPRGTSTLPHARFLAVSSNEKWLVRRLEHFQFHLSLMSLAETEPEIVAEYPDCRFAAFSPDSRLLAILRDDDKTIRVLELGEGVPVERHVLKTEPEAQDDRPSKGFQQLVFLADGRLATADNNGRTWFWNLKGGQPQVLFSTKHADQFLHAAQQAPIVVTAESGVFSILRIDGDQAVLKHHATWTEFGRPESNLTSFAIFPDGRTAISGHLNGAIRFWDITGEKAVEKHPIALQPVASPYVDLAMLPGVVATRDEENHLRLWQPTVNGLVEHPATKADEPQKYLPITSSRDGRLLVTRPIWDGPGCTLWQWDGAKLAPQLSIGRGGAWSAAISSDNRRLAIGYRGTVDLWDIVARPPRLEKTLKATDSNGAAYQMAFAKNNTLLIARMGTVFKAWDLDQEDPQPEKVIMGLEPFHFAVSPVRELLAIDGYGSGSVHLLNFLQFPPQQMTTFQSFLGQNGDLTFSSDGKQLAVSDALSAHSLDRFVVDIHDTETGVRKHRINLPMPLRRLAFTDDSRHLITANANGTIYVLRLEARPLSKQPPK